MDLNELARDQVPARPPVRSPRPVLPEQRRLPDHERMQEETHLARLVRFAAIPLALLAQWASTTTVNAGSIDHAQAAIFFSAVFMREQCLVGRAPKRAIRLESKV